jgi:hypothetical protein
MCRLARVLVVVACGASCGGVLSTEVPDAGPAGVDAASPPVDASVTDDASSSDGSVPSHVPDATHDAQSCSTIEDELRACLSQPSSPPCDGGWVFSRVGDFTAFFEDMAKLYALVVPAHGVDCTAAGLDAGRCNYDPRTPRLDPSDVHYSDADDRFIGPDGRSYVFVYVPDRNQWLVADASNSPATYALIVSYVGCFLRDQ